MLDESGTLLESQRTLLLHEGNHHDGDHEDPAKAIAWLEKREPER